MVKLFLFICKFVVLLCPARALLSTFPFSLFYFSITTAKFTYTVPFDLFFLLLLTAVPSKLTDLLPSCRDELQISIQQAVHFLSVMVVAMFVCVCVLNVCRGG